MENQRNNSTKCCLESCTCSLGISNWKIAFCVIRELECLVVEMKKNYHNVWGTKRIWTTDLWFTRPAL